MINKTNIIDVLNSYDDTDWKKWISDIINHNIAYPISNVSANGDILFEIIDYLRRNEISVFNYEQALSESFAKEYKQNIRNTDLQERYLNAMVNLSSDSCVNVLVSILNSKVNSHNKGKVSYIKTLTLLVLSKTPVLQKKHMKEIWSYILYRGINEMSHDSFFYSTALRFCYKQVSVKSFFKLLNRILVKAETFCVSQKKQIKFLLLDKMDEFHYYKPSHSSRSIKKWLIVIAQGKHKIDINENELFKEFIIELSQMYHSNDLKQKMKSNGSIDDLTLEENIVEVFLSLMLGKDISNNNLMEEDKKLITILNTFDYDEKTKGCFEMLMKNNIDYVLKNTRLPRIPYLNEEEHELVDSLKTLLDSVIYDPENVNPNDINAKSGVVSRIKNMINPTSIH